MFQALQLKENVFEKQLKNILSIDAVDSRGLIDQISANEELISNLKEDYAKLQKQVDEIRNGEITENKTFQLDYDQLKKQINSLAKYLSITLPQNM